MALIKCSECHKEISSKADYCAHCGAPIVKSHTAAGLGCLGIIAVPVLLGIWGAMQPDNPETRRALYCKSSSGAMPYIQAKDFVLQQLKAPSTADFQDYRTTYRGDCDFLVVGYIDAQNGFGAKIRSTYSAEMRYQPDSDRWYTLSVKVQ